MRCLEKKKRPSMDKYFLAPEAGVRTIVEAQPETGQHGSFWPRALGARSWGLTRAQKESLGLQGRAETQDSARLGSFWPPDGQGNDLLTLTPGSHNQDKAPYRPVFQRLQVLLTNFSTGSCFNCRHCSKQDWLHSCFFYSQESTSEGTQQPCFT